MRHLGYAMVALGGLCSIVSSSPAAQAASFYVQTNLVSDISLPGVIQDMNLQNPWGFGFSANSPFWVGDQKKGVSTLYNANVTSSATVVTIPPGAGAGNIGPTGVVNNPGSPNDFKLTGGNGLSSNFIFASLQGTITAWNGSLGNQGTAETEFITTTGAVFTGLAVTNLASNNRLFAADNQNNVITVFGPDFKQTTVSGGNFTDPNLPTGAKAYNIQLLTIPGINNNNPTLVVTYTGGGNNLVDYFGTDGSFIKRLTSDPHLLFPWGVTLAPSGFGDFGGDLLVGNKSNGQINAFDPISGTFLGTVATVLDPTTGLPINGLWALAFRTGASFNPNLLYFDSGFNGSGNIFSHGIFGTITAVPEPSSAILLGLAMLALGGRAAVVAVRSRSAR
jgi:uncharacterized protein (TIGR03118 family)